MTHRNRPRAHKRTIFIFDPHAHKGTVMTFFDPRTVAITSDKTLMPIRRAPVESLRADLKWKRERRRDRTSRSLFESANLRLHRAPGWSDYSAEFSPPGIGTAPFLGKAPLPPEDRRPSATYTSRTAEQCAWWEKISARTAALAFIAAVLTAAVAGSAVIARGDVR